MTDSRLRRLQKLERKRGLARKTLILWRDTWETEEQAIARRFPDGVPAGARLMIIRWLSSADLDPGAPAKPPSP